MSEIVWRGMTRGELDTAYNNSAAVKNSAEKVLEWTERSAQLRADRPQLLDCSYGPKPRNCIDIFKSRAEKAPLLVFIHGGYWQRNSKEVFSCIAEGPLAHGIDVALTGYTLAPEAALTEIVREMQDAVRWLRTEGPKLGIAQGKLIVSGWSAGGHLAAMTLSDADAALSISGIFDIKPCRLNYLNEKLNLTEQETLTLSPIKHLIGEKPKSMIVAFGENELPELQRQSREYFQARTNARLPGELLSLKGHDHFSIIEELAAPGGRLTRAVIRLVNTPH